MFDGLHLPPHNDEHLGRHRILCHDGLSGLHLEIPARGGKQVDHLAVETGEDVDPGEQQTGGFNRLHDDWF